MEMEYLCEFWSQEQSIQELPPADAPDAYFTRFVGPKIAAPVDDAPTRSTAKMGRRDMVCKENKNTMS
jgi:hypothetical protein